MLFRILPIVALMFSVTWLSAATDVRTLGLRGDGVTDDTDALQRAVNGGNVSLIFSKGTYLIGTVSIPSGVVLTGEPGARIRVNPARITSYETGAAGRDNLRCVFALRGSNITLDALEFDFLLIENESSREGGHPETLIFGRDCSDITLARLVAERGEPMPPVPLDQRKERGLGGGIYPRFTGGKSLFNLATFIDSRDLLLRDSRAKFMQCMIDLWQCERVTVDHNRAEDGYAITRARGGDQFLRHVGNWSRGVNHQCRWWGGNANDKRKLSPGDDGWGTATEVKRYVRDIDAGYSKYTAGAYDIMVVNNYAEYGTTLAWGAKGRQVLFQGNIARFMGDYALGSEGGENVTFSGNIVINSFTAGIVAMYWSEKLVITGNTVLVRDEPMEEKYSSYRTAAPYQGGLLRLHAAGPAEKSGAGQVVISGNLFSNELSDRPRRIGIDNGRDVLISGNKIRNGTISTRPGSGRLVVSGNDFTMTAPHEGAWITLSAGMSEAVIRGNTFHNDRPLDQRSPTEMLVLAETGGRNESAQLRLFENNVVQGFPQTVLARGLKTDGKPGTFLIRNNVVDGAVRFEGTRETASLLSYANIDTHSMQEIKAETLDRLPSPLPPAAPTPQDEADAASDHAQLNP